MIEVSGFRFPVSGLARGAGRDVRGQGLSVQRVR